MTAGRQFILTCASFEMDLLDWLNEQLPGQTWSGLAFSAVMALIAIVVTHRIALVAVTRALNEQTLWGLLVRENFRIAELCLVLIAQSLILNAADDGLRWISPIRHFVLVGLILSVTWLLGGTIASLGSYVEKLHPSNVKDNLRARSLQTQARVLTRSIILLDAIVGLSSALMTFPSVRHIGASLLASAGIAGLVVGLAAKPVLANLLAGLQLALTQPIRIDDVLIVQGEWGRVEEITGSYVVIRIWDDRRLIVPLQWFIENPFQNWTRRTAQLMGSIFLWVDYRMPLDPLRRELLRSCAIAPEWDRRFCNLQVTDTSEHCMQLRALVTAADSSSCWDLRCRIREALIDFIQREYPHYLPHSRLHLMEMRTRLPSDPANQSSPEPSEA
jgi:small-conductance mechanosensitive channel